MLLTRGDAFALPRANRFWAFSPKNTAFLSECTKLCLNLQMELREDCFEVIERQLTPRRGKSWFSGVLNDSVVMLYVCKKIKNKIIPKINVKFEDTLNEYFGIG